MKCSKTFNLHVGAGCWVFDLGVGYLPLQRIFAGGLGAARLGANWYLVKDLALTLRNPPGDPQFIDSLGGMFGYDDPGTTLCWYHPITGGHTTFTPLFADWVNQYGLGDDGETAIIYFNGLGFSVKVWAPGGTLATFGVQAGLGPGRPVGEQGHVIWGETSGADFDFYVYKDGVGQTDIGLLASSSTVWVARNGAAGLAAKAPADAFYFPYLWDGAVSSRLAVYGASITRICINSSLQMVWNLNNAAFYSYEPFTGITLLGLPPGAASGSTCYITETGLIIVQADNGVWYYRDGAWGAGVNLLPPGTDWTHLAVVYDVRQTGYMSGYGIFAGTPFTRFWCRICEP